MGYTIRRMAVEDISQVSELDREAFPTEWPPPSFKRELNNPLIRYLVALDDSVTPSGSTEVTEHKTNGTWGRLLSRVRHLLAKGHFSNNVSIPPDRKNIVGYVAIWLMVDEAHLTSIAVRKTHRRQGIGELLVHERLVGLEDRGGMDLQREQGAVHEDVLLPGTDGLLIGR